MWRLKLVIIVLGGFGIYHGWQEYSVGSKASAEPQAVDLAALEKGEVSINDNHIAIGPHVALFHLAVMYGDMDASGQPSSSSKIDYLYYPVISYVHPFQQKIEAWNQSDDSAQPDDFGLFEVSDVAMLVRTDSFSTYGSVPEGFVEQDRVQGLVVNEIRSLGSEELRLLKESIPTLNTDKVVILEDGRKPTSNTLSMGFMGLGGLAALVGLAWLAKPGSAAQATRPREMEE